MKKVSGAIFAIFILLTWVFVHIGGSFDKQFWLSFLPGLMENLVILAVAVIVIDSIYKRESLAKLRQTNARQSQFVLFLSNRLTFLLLKYLGLCNDNELHNDRTLDFEFALERFKEVDLRAVFYKQLVDSEHKDVFVEGFETILRRETQAISKALEAVYPRPDPDIIQDADQIHFSNGILVALKGLIQAFKEANAQVRAADQMKPEHLKLLIDVAFGQVAAELANIHGFVIKLSESAKANQLFISID